MALSKSLPKLAAIPPPCLFNLCGNGRGVKGNSRAVSVRCRFRGGLKSLSSESGPLVQCWGEGVVQSSLFGSVPFQGRGELYFVLTREKVKKGAPGPTEYLMR